MNARGKIFSIRLGSVGHIGNCVGGSVSDLWPPPAAPPSWRRYNAGGSCCPWVPLCPLWPRSPPVDYSQPTRISPTMGWTGSPWTPLVTRTEIPAVDQKQKKIDKSTLYFTSLRLFYLNDDATYLRHGFDLQRDFIGEEDERSITFNLSKKEGTVQNMVVGGRWEDLRQSRRRRNWSHRRSRCHRPPLRGTLDMYPPARFHHALFYP